MKKNRRRTAGLLGRGAKFSPRLVALVVSWSMPAAAWAASPAATPGAPNVIFIVADDLGYGDLGCYGQREIQTPNLDRIAREGMRFTQFYTAAPSCAPARCSLLTGKHAGHALLRANAKIDLRPEDVTIPEVLRGAGYTTGLIGKWGLGKEGGPAAPRKKGFDYFFGFVDQTMAHNYYPHFLVRNEERVPLRNVVPNPGPFNEGVATTKVEYSADLFATDALSFIRTNRARRFFLYYAPTLPHANNEAQPDGMEIPDYGIYEKEDWPSAEKGFAAAVTRLDDHVGQMIDLLKSLNLDDTTLVVFTSDNGPHAEGGHDPARFKSSGGLRGMKRDLYEGGIRVPLIARWPGRVTANETTALPTYFPDVMATLAELAGAKAPTNDGISFLATLLGKGEQPRHQFLYWEFYERATAQAVRFDRWKVLRSPLFTGKVEVYDLERDPGETRDVAAQHPEVVARAVEMMKAAHVPSPLWQVPAAGGHTPSRR